MNHQSSSHRPDRKPALVSGGFWNLYARLRRGKASGLALTTCCELGCELERWLAPTRADLSWQNGGGELPLTELPLYDFQELLVVHHHPCHFRPGLEAHQSLKREWDRLRTSLEAQSSRQPLVAHFWSVDPVGRDVRVYQPELDRLLHPMDLLGEPSVLESSL
ncbi:hypothetical protein JST97_06140 [bacterium]|nr:hypothetical protein [bacterium]